jgi:hypothetical protein
MVLGIHYFLKVLLKELLVNVRHIRMLKVKSKHYHQKEKKNLLRMYKRSPKKDFVALVLVLSMMQVL